MTDNMTDRYGHERPCAYKVEGYEVVVGTRAQAEARAAELHARHAAALVHVGPFWEHVNAWAAANQPATGWDDGFDARWDAEQDRWLAERGVLPEDREFVWSLSPETLSSGEFEHGPYEVEAIALTFADAAAATAPAMTLGERLKAQQAQRDAERLTRAQQASDEAVAAARRHQKAIRDAFEAAKGKVAADIEAGRVLKPIKLPREFEHLSLNGICIDSPRHPDHHLFLEFKPWADANGLRATVEYQHDGVGMDSWHVLRFAPL